MQFYAGFNDFRIQLKQLVFHQAVVLMSVWVVA